MPYQKYKFFGCVYFKFVFWSQWNWIRLNIIPSNLVGIFLLIPDAISCLKELIGNVNNLISKCK